MIELSKKELKDKIAATINNPPNVTSPIQDELQSINYCLCGVEIPHDDPYDGYCIDCG